jgi:hypothetical protein
VVIDRIGFSADTVIVKGKMEDEGARAPNVNRKPAWLVPPRGSMEAAGRRRTWEKKRIVLPVHTRSQCLGKFSLRYPPLVSCPKRRARPPKRSTDGGPSLLQSVRADDERRRLCSKALGVATRHDLRGGNSQPQRLGKFSSCFCLYTFKECEIVRAPAPCKGGAPSNRPRPTKNDARFVAFMWECGTHS